MYGVVMAFVLCNTPATFRILVKYIFIDLLFKFMTIFVDNSNTQSSASKFLECVREALIMCRKIQLALNPKTFLGVHRGVLLIYVVSEKEIEPDRDKIVG